MVVGPFGSISFNINLPKPSNYGLVIRLELKAWCIDVVEILTRLHVYHLHGNVLHYILIRYTIHTKMACSDNEKQTYANRVH